MKRGASIDIGLNFTIIIIIAMIILGLAMVFVLDVFKFADEKVPGTASDIVFHASPDNMLYPDQRPVDVGPGESYELLVSVFNSEWDSDEE
ncbi:hypothetical protein JW711_03050, partial [Candidatus Woesearchaeota archaeon]|nr:hypothetical protein [Candidatus Woesearchaeota archaeon]